MGNNGKDKGNTKGRRKGKANILLVFIMLLGLTFIVFSIVTVVTTHIKESGIRTFEMKAFYAAEAGLNKVLWYLGTPVAQGGFGSDWRGTTEESFGTGSFSVTVQSTASSLEVLIISTGEVMGINKTIIQHAQIEETFPPAFDFCVFNKTPLKTTGNVVISGEVYVGGNTTLGGNSAVVNGSVSHPEGYSVSGNAIDGGTPDPLPLSPTFSTSYYDSEIAIAHTYPAGNQSYSTLNLGGGTVYVNGSVTITSGNITGPGKLVATGAINISGTTVSNGTELMFISEGQTKLTGNTSIPNSTFYAEASMLISGNISINVGSMLTAGELSMSGNTSYSGIIYSEGKTKLSGNATLYGAIVSENLDTITGNYYLNYRPDLFPSTPPPGFGTGSGQPNPIKGTWQEI